MSAAGRAWLRAGALCGLVVLADQVSKALAEARIAVGEKVDLVGPLKLTLTHNEGVAFGLAGGAGVTLVLVGLAALGIVAWIFSREPTRGGIWVAVGLLAGGAIGNLIDRVRAGEVTDFLDLPPWPPFNLADLAIDAGVAMLVAIYLLASRRRPERAGEESGGA